MDWNEAMLFEAQGFGKLELGWRPHHTRPHLADKKAPPLEPVEDGASRARERIKLHNTHEKKKNTSTVSHAAQKKPATHAPSRTCAAAASSSSRSAGAVSAAPATSTGVSAAAPGRRLMNSRTSVVENVSCQRGSEKPMEWPVVGETLFKMKSDETCSSMVKGREAHTLVEKKDTCREADRWQAMRDTNDAINGLLRARRLFQQRCHGVQYKSKDNLVKIGGALYIGEVAKGAPRGSGFLLLPDGAQHVGTFQNGKAHGAGVYLSDGTAAEGQWDQNKRQGVFHVVDQKGKTWIEKYDKEGKKCARKAVESIVDDRVDEMLESTVPAQCVKCPLRYHAPFNHKFACRRHGANILRDLVGTEPPIWTCCGARGEDAPGCDFGYHAAT
eukprot:GEMP01030367.1.p1 GENE.GEMP01030367.1~~GEMP01030367.1.p1  ORF type:complete len:386 (+),score=95.26 GEMP01030367.1:247-1404(+)